MMDSYSRDDSRGPTDSYRRSPGPYERRGRGNRRSRSPPNIDRYQPGRLSRDDDYPPRGEPRRRRSSPPAAQPGIDRYVPGQQDNTPLPVNPLPNPLSLEYQVGFTWFSEWWRMEQRIKDEKERRQGGRRLKGEREEKEERGRERERIQEAYDAYKEKLQVQTTRSFVNQHKSEEWFKERYDPETRQSFRIRLSEFRQGIYAQWEADLDAGYFDEFTLEGIYKNESNGVGGMLEKEEGETTAANEVLGVGDLLPSRGGEVRDEAAFQPTLLIKTIAPTVSREKMEAFCKEHLGEGGGGFRWLSLSDPNPLKKCHRIGWVMLHPASEDDVEKPEPERGDGRDEDAEEGEEPMSAGLGTGEDDLKRRTTAKALELINAKTIHDEERGDFTCHVGVHEPPQVPRKKALWDLFSAPERVERDLHLARRIAQKLHEELGEGYDGIAKIEERVEDLRNKGWLQPPATTSPTKPTHDPDAEEEEGAVDEEEEEGAYDEEVDDEELVVKKKTLDLIVEYLRRVFNTCLFCVFESDSVHELMRKCPGGHLRRPRASLTAAAKAAARASAVGEPFPVKKERKEEDNMDVEGGSPVQERKNQRQSKSQLQLQRAFNWVKTYEDKLMQILEPENVDIRKLGGKPFDEALEDATNAYVKQEDESKWRCKIPECSKLFKGQNFWRKHVEKRHEDFYLKLRKEVEMTTAYVLDPAHIAPSRTDANSNGHFPLGNTHGHPQGTPRGFNLANMPAFGPPGMPGPGFPMGMQTGGMPPGMQYPGMLNPGQPIPGSWINPNAGMSPPMGPDGQAMDGGHQPGPNRRGGRSYGNRANDPYGRPGRDQRNMRWNNGGPPMGGMPMGMGMGMGPMGRGGPVMMGGGMGMPGMPGGTPGMRFDGAGGMAAVGPREAVQGRSLKSYEDLDAAGGSGTGELNY